MTGVSGPRSRIIFSACMSAQCVDCDPVLPIDREYRRERGRRQLSHLQFIRYGADIDPVNLRIILLNMLMMMIAAPTVFSVETVGLASWYGPGFHGRTTASGERFDMNAMTAAHRTLPFGTTVEVHNLETDRSVTVRINDRGPFVDGRIIDVSRAAAAELEMIATGIARVRLRILENDTNRDTPRFETTGSSDVMTVQVASFGSRENAILTQESLRRAGIRAITEDGGTFTRVIVRAVMPDELETTLERLEALGFPDAFVRR